MYMALIAVPELTMHQQIEVWWFVHFSL